MNHIDVPPVVGLPQSSLFPMQAPLLALAPQSSKYTRARLLAVIEARSNLDNTDYTPDGSDYTPSDYDYTPSDYDYTTQSEHWSPPQHVTGAQSHHNSWNQAPQHSSKNVGVIVGAVLGTSIFFVAALLGLLFFLRRKREVNKTNQIHDNGQLEASTAIPITGKVFGDEGAFTVNLHGESKVVTVDHKIPESSGSSTASTCSGESAQSTTPTRRGTDTFTYEELSEATNGFSNKNIIGQGGFGYVYQGVLSNGKLAAIKQLKVGSFQGQREFLAEINIISRIHHRNLVSLIGYSIDGNQKLLVYEYLANNSLAYHLHASETQSVLTWDMRMQIAVGSAKGLAYLHEDCDPKIIHRDIKATNILLDSNFKAKVSDFGLAKFVAEAETHVTTRVMGTFGYLAPEYASSGKLTEKSDVYSFGIVLLELISGRSPIELVDWARPLLADALKNGFYDELVDPKLSNHYDNVEMGRMVACVEASIHPFANNRPQMIQIARVLEGVMSPNDLKVASR